MTLDFNSTKVYINGVEITHSMLLAKSIAIDPVQNYRHDQCGDENVLDNGHIVRCVLEANHMGMHWDDTSKFGPSWGTFELGPKDYHGDTKDHPSNPYREYMY